MTARTRLPALLAPLPGELTTSFVARLAAANGFKKMRDMCYVLGTSFRYLVTGSDGSLATISKYSGVDHDILKRYSRIRIAGPYRSLAGQLFCGMLHSGRFRFCAACVLDDVSAGTDRLRARPWQRACWSFDRLAACPVHGIELSCSEVKEDPALTWDFPYYVSGHMDEVELLLRLARPREVLPVDRHFATRISGSGGSCGHYTDKLEFYVAVQLCENLGAVDMGDAMVPGERKALRDGREICRQRGFEILSAGKEGLFEYFDRRDRLVEGPRAGKHNIYGSVYRYIASKLNRPEFSALADDIREHAACIMVLNPKFQFLGKPLETEKQSIRRASKEYRLDERRIRHVLKDNGLLPNENNSAGRAVFDKAAIEGLLAIEQDGVSIEGAKRDRGFGRKLLKDLVKIGAPIRTNTGSASRRTRFYGADIDAYMEAVFPEKTCNSTPQGYSPVMSARLILGCSVAELLQLIYSGLLKRSKRLNGEKALENLLICLDEARPHLLLPEHDGLTLSAAADILRTGSETVRILIKAGLLEGVERKHSLRRKTQLFVTPQSLQTFRESYVFLSELAGNRGRCKWEKRRLSATGIEPVELPKGYLPPEKHVHYMYRKADLN